MKINLVSIEDGLCNTGFRKLSAFVKSIHDETDIFYVTTGNFRSYMHLLLMKGASSLQDYDIEAISSRLAAADLVGFSSMTHYSTITARIIAGIRRYNPQAYIVWGGIHPIIEPEDAIRSADAICTGEGEFAFQMFLSAFKEGRSFTATPGFWFNTPEGVVRNRNLPLMTAADMNGLPIPTYQDGEFLYRRGRGFAPITPMDFIRFNGLAYKTVWSIGCPFKCTYCGNSKFIDNDRNYRKIRHSSPEVVVAEIKDAVHKHPHISTVLFDDDSFMALPVRVMAEFSEVFKRGVGLPFIITGLIPNYVREDKLKLLISAGMYRVRMGIQSGSQNILEFYDRPTPLPRIRESCAILNKYHKYMIPPAYDIILDNPLEQVEDTVATLDLIHEMPRPFTLNIFSLRVIPNTRLSKAFQERGISATDIRETYTHPAATIANILLFAMVAFPIPKRIYDFFRNKSRPSHIPQKKYETTLLFMRFVYLVKRALDHITFMDFTVLNGIPAYMMWRLGIVGFWHKHVIPRYRIDSGHVRDQQPAALSEAGSLPRNEG